MRALKEILSQKNLFYLLEYLNIAICPQYKFMYFLWYCNGNPTRIMEYCILLFYNIFKVSFHAYNFTLKVPSGEILPITLRGL